MKRFLPALAILLLLLQVFTFPVAATSGVGPLTPSFGIATQAATNIMASSATLNASVGWPSIAFTRADGIRSVSHTSGLEIANMTFPPGTGYFRYGTSPAALTSTTIQVPIAWGQTGFSVDVFGLFPCTTYYFQAVFVPPAIQVDYDTSPQNYLIALVTADGDNLFSGLGIGLNRIVTAKQPNLPYSVEPISGNVLHFTTPGCAPVVTPHGAGGYGYNSGAVGLSNITVQTAAISSTKVAPGERVVVTATVSNKGTVNGATSITLYVNGQEAESKGITLASGQSSPLHFYISENQPGTYSVYVGSVSAGSFTVDPLTNNEIIIYGVIALFTLAIAGTLYMLFKRRPV